MYLLDLGGWIEFFDDMVRYGVKLFRATTEAKINPMGLSGSRPTRSIA